MLNWKLRIVLVAIGTLWPCLGLAQEKLDGRWKGTLDAPGASLTIEVAFKTTSDGLTGTIDIPEQNAKDLQLKNVRFEPPKVHFELPSGLGQAVFDGELKDNVISGSFQQSGVHGTFKIKRGEDRR
jgi:hypothetical protein